MDTISGLCIFRSQLHLFRALHWCDLTFWGSQVCYDWERGHESSTYRPDTYSSKLWYICADFTYISPFSICLSVCLSLSLCLSDRAFLASLSYQIPFCQWYCHLSARRLSPRRSARPSSSLPHGMPRFSWASTWVDAAHISLEQRPSMRHFHSN